MGRQVRLPVFLCVSMEVDSMLILKPSKSFCLRVLHREKGELGWIKSRSFIPQVRKIDLESLLFIHLSLLCVGCQISEEVLTDVTDFGMILDSEFYPKADVELSDSNIRTAIHAIKSQIQIETA